MTDTPPKWLPPWLKDSVAPVLAILVVAGGMVILYLKPEDGPTQIIGAWVTLVLSYYFGSSKSSQAKDETISTVLEKREK